MKLLVFLTKCLLCISQINENALPMHKEAPKEANFSNGGSSGVYDYLRFVNEMNLGLSVYKRALPLKLPVKMRRNKFE